MTSLPAEAFEELLNDFEDLLLSGVRRPRAVPQAPPSPPLPGEFPAAETLAALAEAIEGCRLCPLGSGRTRAVPGEGVSRPLVLAVGEGPGQEEDLSGRPFVGPAGQYLDKWLSSVGLSRKTNCYIANTVKCRPPGNRDPVPEETQACLPYLNRQLDLLKPRFILALGRVSGQLLSGENVSLSRLRGRLLSYRGFPLLVTYHPSGVLRNPDEYRPLVWEDLKRLRDLLRSAPEAGKTGEGGE